MIDIIASIGPHLDSIFISLYLIAALVFVYCHNNSKKEREEVTRRYNHDAEVYTRRRVIGSDYINLGQSSIGATVSIGDVVAIDQGTFGIISSVDLEGVVNIDLFSGWSTTRPIDDNLRVNINPCETLSLILPRSEFIQTMLKDQYIARNEGVLSNSRW